MRNEFNTSLSAGCKGHTHYSKRQLSADAILSFGKQIIVSLGHVGACTLKHERSEP